MSGMLASVALVPPESLPLTLPAAAAGRVTKRTATEPSRTIGDLPPVTSNRQACAPDTV
jgi:hypothetical protein